MNWSGFVWAGARFGRTGVCLCGLDLAGNAVWWAGEGVGWAEVNVGGLWAGWRRMEQALGDLDWVCAS